MDNGLKSCSNCFETKPVAEFYRKLDGFQSRCKSCNAEVVRGYYRRLQAKRIRDGWRDVDKRRVKKESA